MTERDGALDYSIFSKEQRYLVKLLQGAFAHNIITNTDKLRVWGPNVVFNAYADEPERQEHVLRGVFPSVKPATARKMPLPACISMVTTAIEEGDLDADTFFMYIPEEEIVRVMDPTSIFALVDNTGWWDIFTAEHQAYMAYLLEQYIEERLGGDGVDRWATLVEGIGLQQFMEASVPVEVRTEVFSKAYFCGKRRIHFTADVILDAAPPQILVTCIPLRELYKPIQAASLTYGFVPGAAPEAPAPAGTSGDGNEERETRRPDQGTAQSPPMPHSSAPSVTEKELDELLREHSSGSRKLPEGSTSEDRGTGQVLEIEMDE